MNAHIFRGGNCENLFSPSENKSTLKSRDLLPCGKSFSFRERLFQKGLNVPKKIIKITGSLPVNRVSLVENLENYHADPFTIRTCFQQVGK